MYSQSHLKRILPRRDDHFRTTEFPSQYYSNSSVYSYSPTSSSDCPEHGRSHRRTKIILTLSVTFATLGVLSIAGVAVYLGLLSKNINNGSQLAEESYLYSTAVNPKVPSTAPVEDLFQMPNGRSRSDFFPDDPVDLTNQLGESHQSSHPQPHPEDSYLNTKPNNPTQIFYSTRNTSSSTRNNKFPPSPGPTGVPSPVMVSSERILAPPPPPPVDLQSPLIILGPKRNKSSTNPYNVHSTITNERVTVHFEQEDNTGTLITKHQQGHTEQDLRRRPIVVQQSSTIPRETTTAPTNTKAIGTTVIIGTVHAHHPNDEDPGGMGVNRQGVPMPGPPPPPAPELTSSLPHLASIEPHPGQVTRPMRPSHSSMTNGEGFHPVNPPNYGGSPPPADLMANHKVQLTFDRVAPDFYDKKPWTPLLIRPAQQLDKRPRVEGIVPLVVSPGDEGESEETYYAYGGTGGVENSKGKPQEPLRMMTPVGDDGKNNGSVGMGGDKEPIRHGQGMMDYPTINSDEEEGVDNPHHSTVEYVKGGNHDSLKGIPAYTLTPDRANASVVPPSRDFMSTLLGDKESRMGTEIGEKSTGPYADAEEYEEDDEEEESDDEDDERGPIKSKVYTLDPTNTDMFPQPIEIGQPVAPPEFQYETPLAHEQNVTAQEGGTGDEHNGTTDKSEPLKPTTDFILSTLGNLNLVKSKSPGDMLPEEVKASQPGSETPLFPPGPM